MKKDDFVKQHTGDYFPSLKGKPDQEAIELGKIYDDCTADAKIIVQKREQAKKDVEYGLALLVSVATGVIAGFLPAWRAARMNPVDALRAE